eukprot:11057336-Alexandrium_andersonii.AAC.1
MDDMAGWDVAASRRALANLTTDEARMHRAVGSGGVWSSDLAFKAGHVDSPQCSRCGHPVGTIHHMLWECEATSFARQHLHLTVQERETLPVCLSVYGIAPRLLDAATSHPAMSSMDFRV